MEGPWVGRWQLAEAKQRLATPMRRWSRARDPLVAADRYGEQQEMHRTIDLDAMLAIERRTGKR
jgi:hypothetical protein